MTIKSSVTMPMRSLAQLHRHYLTSRVGTFALCHTVSPALFSTSHFSTPRDEAENVRQQQIEAENWAKQPGSREVLAQPTFKVNHNDLFEDGKPRGHHDQLAVFRPLDSLEAYLKARQWHHPEGPARRILSHLLTYPLTLAAGIHNANMGFSRVRDASSASNKNIIDVAAKEVPVGMAVGGEECQISVVCIGARAESTLPPALWRELLFALPEVSYLDFHLIGPELSVPSGVTPSSSARGGQNGPPPPGHGIDEADERKGPPLHHPSTKVTVQVGSRTADITWTRAVVRRTTGACVEVQRENNMLDARGSEAGAAVDRAMAKADIFVLFNPGLGHPHLREGWEGAVKRLLTSGKPIIVSCHSQKDLDRDAKRLQEIGKQCCPGWTKGRGVNVFPRKNAFGSLMASQDPISRPGAEEIVSSNWGLLVIPAADDSSL